MKSSLGVTMNVKKFALLTSTKTLFRGYYVNECSFFILLLLYFIICTYLSHSKFIYNSWFSSNIDTIYLFKFLVLIFEVMRSDGDTIEIDKIMWLYIYIYIYNMYLQIFQLSNWEVVEQNNQIKCKYFQNDSNDLIVNGVKRSICNKVGMSICHIVFFQRIYAKW